MRTAPTVLRAALLSSLLLTSAAAHEGDLPRPRKVVVVVLENHTYEEIAGNVVDAPFINGTLIQGGLLYTDAHGTQHPSQPNYLDLFSGDTQGVNNGNAAPGNAFDLNLLVARLQAGIANPATPPAQIPGLQALLAQIQGALNAGLDPKAATGDAFPIPRNFNDVNGTPVQIPFTTPNLASELRDVRRTFIEFCDGLRADGAVDDLGVALPGIVNNPADPFSVGYAHRHDPAADWISDAPVGNQLPLSAVQDFANFNAGADDFDFLPDVSLIVPDTIHDMHDGRIPQSTRNGDAWLAANLGGYLEWARHHRGLLIVTTDESDGGVDNHIMAVVNGDRRLFQAGTQDQRVSHFELLRTIESMFGADYAGASAQVRDFAADDGRLLASQPDPRQDDDERHGQKHD